MPHEPDASLVTDDESAQVVEAFDYAQRMAIRLMRDTKRGQKVFNRLLGLRWLKKHIDPAYYQDYPLSEEEDDPEAYFHQFLEDNSARRLIKVLMLVAEHPSS